MMEAVKLIIIGIFLPLFPLSIIFNVVFERLPYPALRGAVLLAWPLVGIYILHGVEEPLPDWVIIWAVSTAILYAFRLLAVRQMGLWIGFLATSAWSLLWIALNGGVSNDFPYLLALGFSIPLALLALLDRHIELRFGAAYTDLYGGLALTTPRLAGVLVFAVLAATATPVFPAFFLLLATIVNASPGVVVCLLLTWLLWTWASARLLQGLVVGPIVGEKIQDIGAGLSWLYAGMFLLLVVAGIYLTGGLL
jgi:hypothetical protein